MSWQECGVHHGSELIPGRGDLVHIDVLVHLSHEQASKKGVLNDDESRVGCLIKMANHC